MGMVDWSLQLSHPKLEHCHAATCHCTSRHDYFVRYLAGLPLSARQPDAYVVEMINKLRGQSMTPSSPKATQDINPRLSFLIGGRKSGRTNTLKQQLANSNKYAAIFVYAPYSSPSVYGEVDKVGGTVRYRDPTIPELNQLITHQTSPNATLLVFDDVRFDDSEAIRGFFREAKRSNIRVYVLSNHLRYFSPDLCDDVLIHQSLEAVHQATILQQCQFRSCSALYQFFAQKTPYAVFRINNSCWQEIQVALRDNACDIGLIQVAG
jgi:hypothetical protein